MKNLVIAVACLLSVAACDKSYENKTRAGIDDRAHNGNDRRVVDASGERNDANNTGVNTRDRDGALPTPADQASNATDLGNVTAIRKRLVDSELSTDAKNVKVISDKGRVTLRGPVRTAAEKDSVAQIARDVAGSSNVDDLIDVVAAR